MIPTEYLIEARDMELLNHTGINLLIERLIHENKKNKEEMKNGKNETRKHKS